MTFAEPWALLALIALPAAVVAYRSMRRRRAVRADELAAQGLVATSPEARLGRRRHVPFGIFVLALTVLVFALARPSMNVSVPHREGTVILAFDVSNSMNAGDIEPTRIEAAKAAARAFVERQPSTIRIGVVAFGDGAVIVQTPTDVAADVTAAIDRLLIGGGTSLGQGIFASLSAIAGKPLTIDESALHSDSGEIDIGYFGSAVIVLLSDGENTSRPDPLTVAEIASVAGVHVHVIGLGTVDGTVVETQGFNVATALDRDLLTEVAGLTDGVYYEASDAGALVDIYEKIDLEFTADGELTEVTGGFTAIGAVLLAAGALLSVLWLGRVM